MSIPFEMRSLLISAVCCLAVACVGSRAIADTATAPDEKKVHILATGGTIAGSAAQAKAKGTYKVGVVSVEQLVDSVPELAEIAELQASQVANIASQDMTHTVWLKLAQQIAVIRKANPQAGVVITHGTDTLEETAFFLDLLFPAGAPIVVTGSMRPSDAPGADGPANLKDAVSLAASANAHDRGVLVVLNSRIYNARNITKSHTENVVSFQADDSGIAGEFVLDEPVFFQQPRSATLPDVDVSEIKLLPRVDIVPAYATSDAKLVQAALSLGPSAIVIQGVGNGNVSAPMREAMSAASEQGIRVIRASRVVDGVVSRNVEINDDANNYIASLDLSPHKARILAQLVIALDAGVGAAALQSAFTCDAPLVTEMCRSR